MFVFLIFLCCIVDALPSDQIPGEDMGAPNGTLKKGKNSSSSAKVLLILGPQGSGKSTMVSAVLEVYPLCRTINRKEIMNEVNLEVCRGMLDVPLSEIQRITGKEVTNLDQLHLIKQDDIEVSEREGFAKNKADVLKIISSKEFDDFVLEVVFKNYRKAADVYLSENMSVIIDEAEIYSEEKYQKFYANFSGVDVKNGILFNSLDDLLEKYKKRNYDFIKLLKEHRDLDTFLRFLGLQEREKGDSRLNYRPVSRILNNYQKFFVFSPTKPISKKRLDKISRFEMSEFLKKVIKIDDDIQEEVKEWEEFFIKRYPRASIEIDPILNSIFRNAQEVHILCGIEFDYLIKSRFDSGYTSQELMGQLPKELLAWLVE